MSQRCAPVMPPAPFRAALADRAGEPPTPDAAERRAKALHQEHMYALREEWGATLTEPRWDHLGEAERRFFVEWATELSRSAPKNETTTTGAVERAAKAMQRLGRPHIDTWDDDTLAHDLLTWMPLARAALDAARGER